LGNRATWAFIQTKRNPKQIEENYNKHKIEFNEVMKKRPLSSSGQITIAHDERNVIKMQER
jgi:hypothetical protein